jgi:signal transduction histidine kinase
MEDSGAYPDPSQMQPGEQPPEFALFLASTVHDMKNSVSVVSGTLESLLGGPSAQDNPAYGQMAQMLYQTRRLNDKLMQLLAIYKQVGKPGYPFDPAPQMVAQLVGQAVAQEQIQLNARGLRVETAFAPELIWTVDEDLVLGVIGNAVNNAIRYTRDAVRIAAVQDGDWLEIRVEDNGEGFSPALLAAGDRPLDGVDFVGHSTGLGLYFSSEVARMHRHRERRGSIRLENGGTLGGGCFILRLP